MIPTTSISVETEGPVCTITFRRPRKLNALTDAITTEMTAALDVIASDDSIRVVVLTGEGRAFSAGFDVSEGEDMPERNPAYWKKHFSLAFTALRRMWSLPQPIVAKVRGACLGGGFAFSLACDLAYCSDDAYFGEPEVKFGGSTMFPLLPFIVGIRTYNELLFTGRFLDAAKAASLGIVNEMVPAADLDARVDQVVRHMCLLPSGTLVKNKSLMHRYYDAMGMQTMINMTMDNSIIGLSVGNDGEFVKISRELGVTAALQWQKARFKEVGAF